MISVKPNNEQVHWLSLINRLNLHNKFKKNKMKVNVFFKTMLIGIIAIGCTSVREKTAEEILENSKLEQEIYNAIIADSTHLSRLMDKMMADDNCKIKMTENGSLVKAVCMSPHMDSLMNQDGLFIEHMSNRIIQKMMADSVICDKTCTKMMENDRVKNYFKEHPFK